MKTITTIKLSTETKERLDKVKEHPKESYDEVLKKILFVLNTVRKDPEQAKKILLRIDSNFKRTLKKEQPL